MNKKVDKWYHDGLRFTCQNCGKCCQGPGGYVWLTEKEAELLAEVKNVSLAKFYATFTRICRGKLAIIDSANGDCVFLKNNHCEVYEARPIQCRTFPWWHEIIGTSKDWNSNVYQCPGINQGKLHSAAEIESCMWQDPEN
jgi:Fe-S-cluster containining protein